MGMPLRMPGFRPRLTHRRACRKQQWELTPTLGYLHLRGRGGGLFLGASGESGSVRYLPQNYFIDFSTLSSHPPNSEQLRQRPAPVLTQIPASQGRRSALSLSDLRARTKASAEVPWVQQGGDAPLEVGGCPKGTGQGSLTVGPGCFTLVSRRSRAREGWFRRRPCVASAPGLGWAASLLGAEDRCSWQMSHAPPVRL